MNTKKQILFFLMFISVLIAPCQSYGGIASQFQIGAGYNSNSCEFSVTKEKAKCYSSPRLTLGVSFGSDGDSPPAASSSGNSTVVYGNNCMFCNFHFYQSNNDSVAFWVIFLGVIVVVLIFYGIFAALGGAFSSRLSFGFFYTGDYPQANDQLHNDYLLKNIHRFGANFGFYFGSSDMAMRLSTAYTIANFDHKDSETDVVETFSTEGLSSSLALGWIPHPKKSGMFGYYEFEGSYHTGGDLFQKRKSLSTGASFSNVTHAFVMGWAF